MNSYERYMGMVRGEAVDCVPRIPILMHFAADYIGAAYGAFAGGPKVMFEANRRLVEDFGYDHLDIMSDPYRETSAFGGEVTYRDEGVPRCTAPLKDAADLSLLERPSVERSERLRSAVETIGLYKDYGWRRYSITGWVEGPAAEAACLRGVEGFLTDLLIDPAWACALMDVCVETAIEYATAQIAAGADTIGMGDAIASQISPGMYAEFVAPRERRIVDAIHEAGGLARLHICGDITRHLPFIGEVGVDIVDCDWMVDMQAARAGVGPDVTLTGNLNPATDILHGTPESIHAGFKKIFEQVGRPYFVNAGCEIPSGTPRENLEALCRPIPVE